jgi:hypothetical protein
VLGLRHGERIGEVRVGGWHCDTVCPVSLFFLFCKPKKEDRNKPKKRMQEFQRQRSLNKNARLFLSSFYSVNQKKRIETNQRNECKSFKDNAP